MNFPKQFFQAQIESKHTLPQTKNSNAYQINHLDEVKVLSGHEGCVNTLSYNKSGSLLLSGSDDENVCIWKNEQLQYKIYTKHHSNIFSAKFSIDDKKVFSCAMDGEVIVTELMNLARKNGDHYHSEKLYKFNCHGDTSMEIQSDLENSNIFYSCSEDGTINRYDLREIDSCNCARKHCNKNLFLDINEGPHSKSNKIPFNKYTRKISFKWENEANSYFGICSFDFDPFNYNNLIVGTSNDLVMLYDKRKPSSAVLKYRPEHLKPVEGKAGKFKKISSIKYNPEKIGEVLASYSRDGLYLLDTYKASFSGKEDDIINLGVFKGHRNEQTMIKESNFFLDHIVTGSDDGNVFVYNRETSKIVNYFQGDGSIVNCLEPHPTESILAVSGIDNTIKIFKPNPKKEIHLEYLEEVLKENIDNSWGDDLDLDGEEETFGNVFGMDILTPEMLLRILNGIRTMEREEVDLTSESSHEGDNDEVIVSQGSLAEDLDDLSSSEEDVEMSRSEDLDNTSQKDDGACGTPYCNGNFEEEEFYL
ncbi:hypothetical protein HK099_008143 [Clydaea vesicula]|uniref:WD repeat-containing protein n=1 Tax=Clydaea vesicula TaxID=447962 RepID=A0AAD5XY27_9FUNG|nr:hypothetical protein HK099_008143 [Clydaea vesicula]KAJ3378163.1 hypothetical protein HDU92_007611 [Lobulomyces angularis]